MLFQQYEKITVGVLALTCAGSLSICTRRTRPRRDVERAQLFFRSWWSAVRAISRNES